MVGTLPSQAEFAGLIPGRQAKILHALGPKSQNIKQKQYCNKFVKTLEMVRIKKKIFKRKKKENVSDVKC